jgi:hypothetical protein
MRPGVGPSWQIWPPQNEQGSVRVEAGVTRVAFTHPLVRSTVVDVASTGDRIAAQLRLAEALAHDQVRYARHLAEAAVGQDEDVAQLLERPHASSSSAGTPWERSRHCCEPRT